MGGDLFSIPDPDVALERAVFETEYKGKDLNRQLSFFNNFFFYFPHHTSWPRQDHLDWARQKEINSAPGCSEQTFRVRVREAHEELNIDSERLKDYSQLFLDTKIPDFYEQIDSLLEKEGILDLIRTTRENILDLCRDQPDVADSIAEVYFGMRELGYWCYKDLIA